MALVEDERTGGFTFTWSIHNFSYFVQKEAQFIDSPQFVVDAIGSYKWYLRLYPRGDNYNGFISFYLRQNGNASVVKSVLSIRANDGLFKERGEQTFYTNKTSSQGYGCFLSFVELKEPDAFLFNDTLTLRCRIWKNDAELEASVRCYAHSNIKISKLYYMWILKDLVLYNKEGHITEKRFNQSTNIASFSPEIPCFKIHLLDGESFEDDTIHFAIEKEDSTARMFVICMIHLLDADGKIAHSVRGEYLFDVSDKSKIWTFPFLSKRKFLSREKLYLKSGVLTLRCEFSVSKGDISSEIERYEYETTDDLHLATNNSSQACNSDLSGSWKENMRRFYNEEKFSDVTVRTPNRQFPAHKAILCAQSEVFSAMFERDMKENRTGVVEIEDLEDDTISKMLMFLYTNTLEDLEFSMACKLYFAADKYRITALHKKCSKYLIRSLDTSNVCDVLALADTHQDEELKSVARDFIFDHDNEIIDSDDWKKLMEAKPHLTSETMQMMICKKFFGYLKP